MRDWYHQRRTDLALRLDGALLCCLSFLAFRMLAQMPLPPHPATPGAATFALAAVGCICASAGAALLMYGHHIFDKVEIVEHRCRAHPHGCTPYRSDDGTQGQPASSEANAFMVPQFAGKNGTVETPSISGEYGGASMLFVDQDENGRWIVHEGPGKPKAGFNTFDAAFAFVHGEQHGLQGATVAVSCAPLTREARSETA